MENPDGAAPEAPGGRGRGRECFNCGQVGHESRDCPEPRQGGGRGGFRGEQDEEAYSSFGAKRGSDRACYNCDQAGPSGKSAQGVERETGAGGMRGARAHSRLQPQALGSRARIAAGEQQRCSSGAPDAHPPSANPVKNADAMNVCFVRTGAERGTAQSRDGRGGDDGSYGSFGGRGGGGYGAAATATATTAGSRATRSQPAVCVCVVCVGGWVGWVQRADPPPPPISPTLPPSCARGWLSTLLSDEGYRRGDCPEPASGAPLR